MAGSHHWPGPPAELISYVNTTNVQLLNLNKQLLELSRTLVTIAPISDDDRKATQDVLAQAASDAEKISKGLEAVRRDIARYRPN